jgi:hypothetical protein
MVKEPSQTKNAIYLREKYAQAKALKGLKPLIPPPQDAEGEAPANLWKQHHAYPAYYGRPDGQIWSAKLGRIIEGTLQSDGYYRLTIDGKLLKRSRFNLSLSLGRAIGEEMDCDHIVPVSRGGGDDWANLQELTKEAHRRKTALDNPDRSKKSGITTGIPIIARHVFTGEETRYHSVIEAARELGMSSGVIAKSLKGETIKCDYVFSHTPEHLAEQADLPGEIWLEAISTWGLLPNVKASDRGRIQDSFERRSYGCDKHGYKGFQATIDKKAKGIQVHDVIARTFLEPPPSLEHTSDHINGDPSDNRAENLRWATSTEQGRNMKSNRRVIQLDLITGEQLAVFGSLAEAAEGVGISADSIRHVAAGRHLNAGGFKWTFTEDALRSAST